MNKLLNNIKCITASSILLVMVFILGAQTTQASVLDWFSGDKSAFSSPYITASFAYISRDHQGLDQGQKDVSPVTVENNSLVSYRSPGNLAKLSIQKNTKIQLITVPATAYSSTIDQTDDDPFTTAWGTNVRDGIVAANFLPFGTKIKIPEIYGDKIFVIEDRMNRRYSNRIDIWFPNRESALEFGLQTVKIQVLE